ncbi:Plasmodium vivax Vir protein, putative [Plasmodium vivax]|nr:Plasmodium vivax Vir protein, putative [Plasmodium vivax]
MFSFSFYCSSPFYKYKKLFNNSMENKDESQKELCTGIIKSNEGFDKIYNEDDFYKVCPVSLYYLDDLYKNSYNFMDEGCKYLYYGIYNNILKKENYSYDKLEFYKILLEGYYNINEWDSYESYIKEINKDILENNNDLMEMYDNLDNFKENKSQNKDDQCFPCDNSQNFLPYIGRSNLKIILIPIILITLKLFILYILYKLTPLRSWIHILLRRKKGIQNNIDQRNYQLHNLSKQNKSAFTNRSYNITYISVNDS